MSAALGRIVSSGITISCPACGGEARLTDWTPPWNEYMREYCCALQHVTYLRQPTANNRAEAQLEGV